MASVPFALSVLTTMRGSNTRMRAYSNEAVISRHTRDYEAYCRERQGELDPAIWAVPALGVAAAASEGDWGGGCGGGGG